MSMVLKLDGCKVRGRLWKELNTCGKPLKQGILMSKKMCSYCNETPDTATEVIECMSCHSSFHTTCLLKPVSETFLKMTLENPSVFWFCPACISCKSADSAADVQSADENENNMGTNVIMQSTLLNFKKDILQLVSETMDKKLNALSSVVNSKSESKKVHQINADSIESSAKTWQAMSNIQHDSTPTTVSQTEYPPLGENSDVLPSGKNATLPTKKQDKHVLLLKPSNGSNVTTKAEQKKSLNAVYRAVTDVNVEFCSVKSSGVIAMGFPDSDSKKLAEEKIKEDALCSSTFIAESPKKMLPKVTVRGINEILFHSCNHDNCDELKA